MNSKRRVRTVLDGGIPDRVPIGEFAVDFDTVEKIIGHETYLRAKAKSRIAFWENRHDEVAESYLKDHIELHEKLDLDIVTFPMATWQIPPESDDPPPRRIDDSTWEDKYGRVFKYSRTTEDITCVRDPDADERVYTAEEFQREPREPERDKRSREILDAVVQRFKDEKYICGASGGEIGIVLLGGMERGCMELALNPEAVKAATALMLAEQNLADDVYVHPGQDGVLWGADFGYKTGPFISPGMFREFFVDANRQRVEKLHARGLKVLKHACGNNRALLDMFVEMGYDCYQSIQPTAGMDICEIKKTHGGRMALWGGVAVENLLSGTAEDCRADVRRAMKCAKPGGGFILGSSHSIAVGTVYDNYMAVLDEHRKSAAY
ncbi:MAG: hypothetical protein JW909_05540 [Planctomycetes bacterium]|nr:hypothetical protein [Planctomycetota bacterium]